MAAILAAKKEAASRSPYGSRSFLGSWRLSHTRTISTRLAASLTR